METFFIIIFSIIILSIFTIEYVKSLDESRIKRLLLLGSIIGYCLMLVYLGDIV